MSSNCDQLIICSGQPLKLNHRSISGTQHNRNALFRPIFHPKIDDENTVWNHEVANHYRDVLKKKRQKPAKLKKRQTNWFHKIMYAKRSVPVVRDRLAIPHIVFPRSITSHGGYRRERVCQHGEAQILESDRLRDIRVASTLSDLYRLFGIRDQPKTVYKQSSRIDRHCKELKIKVISNQTQQLHRRRCRTSNPISGDHVRNHVLTSGVRGSNIDADCETSQNQPSEPHRQTTTSKHTSKPLGRCAALDSARRHQQYSLFHNRAASEEHTLNNVEHELDEGEYYDDNADPAAENLEWYIRLASRCYRDGFEWYADYLRGKGTLCAAKPITRRPLQLIIERHLEQLNKVEEESRGSWCSSQVDSTRRPLEAPRSTTPDENQREFEIRIQISPSGDAPRAVVNHRLPPHNPSHKPNAANDGVISENSIKLYSNTHLKLDLDNNDPSLKTPQQSVDLIDEFSALNLSASSAAAPVHHASLPRIVLTDCCSNNDVCHDAISQVTQPRSTSTSFIRLSTPSTSEARPSSHGTAGHNRSRAPRRPTSGDAAAAFSVCDSINNCPNN